MATEPMAIARVLTGTAKNINVRQWSPTSADIPHEGTLPPWKIVARVLEGGRQEGIDIIEIAIFLLTSHV